MLLSSIFNLIREPSLASALACASEPVSTTGRVSVTLNVATTATYTVWSRVIAPDTQPASYVSYGNGQCVTNGGLALTPNTLTWINYQDGNVSNLATMDFTAGTHEFVLTAASSGLGIDKVMLIAGNCTPQGDGSNCTTENSGTIVATPTESTGSSSGLASTGASVLLLTLGALGAIGCATVLWLLLRRSRSGKVRSMMVAATISSLCLVGTTAYAATITVIVINPEQGTLSSGAIVAQDSSASNGQVVRFATTPDTPVTNCPNPTHTPGGDDGMGGCWPYEGNTGIPTGTVLTPYAGPCTINAWNTTETTVTLDAVDATSCSQILVQDNFSLVITNSKLPVINFTESTGSLYVADSELHNAGAVYGVLWGENITGTRLNISGGQQSVQCSGSCTITDSFLHGQNAPAGSETHNNAFLSNGGSDMIVRHNTLFCSPEVNDVGGGCSGNLSLFGDFDHISDVQVDKNLFVASSSSGYCGRFGYDTFKPYGSDPTNISVTDNIFQRGSSGMCGTYGSNTSFLAANGNIWSNNRYDDGSIVAPN